MSHTSIRDKKTKNNKKVVFYKNTRLFSKSAEAIGSLHLLIDNLPELQKKSILERAINVSVLLGISFRNLVISLIEKYGFVFDDQLGHVAVQCQRLF